MKNGATVRMSVPYFQVPNSIFDVGLNNYQLVVYMYLCRCGNHGGTAFPSYKTIAEKCGISKRKAIDTVKELEVIGLLTKTTRPKDNNDNLSNIYEVNTPSAPHALGSAQHAPASAPDAPYKEQLYKEPREKEYKYISLPTDENMFLSIYDRIHKKYLGRNHVRVTPEQSEHIINAVEKLADYYDVAEEDWEDAVEEHFKYLPESNNGNILAFLKTSYRYFEVDPYNL